MNEKSGAERLPPLDIGHSVLDIECSEKEVDTQDRGYLNQAREKKKLLQFTHEYHPPIILTVR